MVSGSCGVAEQHSSSKFLEKTFKHSRYEYIETFLYRYIYGTQTKKVTLI